MIVLTLTDDSQKRMQQLHNQYCVNTLQTPEETRRNTE